MADRMAPLLKDGSATFEQGLDLARRREFDRAADRFNSASAKLSKEGNLGAANLARAYASLMLLGTRRNDPGALLALSALLRSTLGSTELRPGPRAISAEELAVQLDLGARDLSLVGAAMSGAGQPQVLAQELQTVANEYQRLGSQALFLPELFEQRTVMADSRSPYLMALSYETLGHAVQGSDPLGAAEHFQIARQYWVQAGDEARAHQSALRVGDLSIRARCWFCGREGSGHGIQFTSLPIDIEVTGLKGLEGSPLPSLDASGRNVYACKGCASSLRLLADRMAIARALEVEQRLMAQIQALEHRLRARGA